jgi:endonuclease YncB( thermonuclease family)
MRTILVVAILFPLTATAATITGKVVGISDGDTLTVLDASNIQHKIRLAGIDAPEKKQAFGEKSKQSLSDCAYGKAAVIEYDKKDRYGRTVGKVIVGGTDCNLRQLELGLAWHYKNYASEQSPRDRDLYARIESMAIANARGLWGDRNPTPPWTYRKLAKQN